MRRFSVAAVLIVMEKQINVLHEFLFILYAADKRADQAEKRNQQRRPNADRQAEQEQGEQA